MQSGPRKNLKPSTLTQAACYIPNHLINFSTPGQCPNCTQNLNPEDRGQLKLDYVIDLNCDPSRSISTIDCNTNLNFDPSGRLCRTATLNSNFDQGSFEPPRLGVLNLEHSQQVDPSGDRHKNFNFGPSAPNAHLCDLLNSDQCAESVHLTPAIYSGRASNKS